ncbi:COesterase domain containing protein [Asbolus verrucosus]|uniref:COesterase domain containing protein n=1 Tax=Asbolus verrucosus TaxID=1661398 RepID=A0A482VZZ4_ASBVE|nr:COesterase domain containing protein [Asbolus verrucosus]
MILITFNYGFGIFVFLSSEEDVIPGNKSLRDQLLVLKWMQEKITCLSGNPGLVALTGLSAGSSSFHLHYFSEMSKGLFYRGFSQVV